MGLCLVYGSSVAVEEGGLWIDGAGESLAPEAHAKVVFFVKKENVGVESADGPEGFGGSTTEAPAV